MCCANAWQCVNAFDAVPQIRLQCTLALICISRLHVCRVLLGSLRCVSERSVRVMSCATPHMIAKVQRHNSECIHAHMYCTYVVASEPLAHAHWHRNIIQSTGQMIKSEGNCHKVFFSVFRLYECAPLTMSIQSTHTLRRLLWYWISVHIHCTHTHERGYIALARWLHIIPSTFYPWENAKIFICDVEAQHY